MVFMRILLVGKSLSFVYLLVEQAARAVLVHGSFAAATASHQQKPTLFPGGSAQSFTETQKAAVADIRLLAYLS